MEYLPGVRLVDGVREQFSHFAAKQGKTLAQMEAEQKEKVRPEYSICCCCRCCCVYCLSIRFFALFELLETE